MAGGKNKWLNKVEGQDEAMFREWRTKSRDIFQEITDKKKKVIEITNDVYDDNIVDFETGKPINDRPWFFVFVHGN